MVSSLSLGYSCLLNYWKCPLQRAKFLDFTFGGAYDVEFFIGSPLPQDMFALLNKLGFVH